MFRSRFSNNENDYCTTILWKLRKAYGYEIPMTRTTRIALISPWLWIQQTIYNVFKPIGLVENTKTFDFWNGLLFSTNTKNTWKRYEKLLITKQQVERGPSPKGGTENTCTCMKWKYGWNSEKCAENTDRPRLNKSKDYVR